MSQIGDSEGRIQGDTADLKRMRQATDMMRSALNAPQRKQAEALFLLGLGDAARNPLLSRAIEDGLAELFLPFESMPADASAAVAMKAFEELLRAVGEEDPVASERAMAGLHVLLWDAIRRITRIAA